MDILILNGGYLGAAPSGGDRHLLALAAGLVEHPMVASVRYYAPDLVEEWLPSEVDLATYSTRLPRSTIETVLVYAVRLARAMRLVHRETRPPANIVLTSPGLVDMLAAFYHRLRYGSRIGIFAFHIGDVRATGSIRRRFQTLVSSLAAWPTMVLLRRADIILTSTTTVADDLVARGIPRERIVFQRPAVDVEAIRQAPSLPATDVLFVGRLVARKGVFDLLEAAQHFPGTIGLVGDGEEMNALRQRVAADGLEERVRFYGAVDDAEVFGLMRGAGVLVLPSYEEGYSLVIAEALVAGTQVVAYALPHYTEVFGDAIVQVPLGDVEQLGSALVKVLESQKPPVELDFQTGDGAARELVEFLEAL